MLLQRVCPGCRARSVGVCGRCLSALAGPEPGLDLPALDGLTTLFGYDDRVQRIVVAAKNGGRRDVLRQLGSMLARQLESMAVEQPAVVTWVPASGAGRRRRGFDQGAILARAVAAELAVPCRRLLLRRPGRRQFGRPRGERLVGPDLGAPVACSGRLFLVDDVITTGASISTAANALRQAGARWVYGSALARAPVYGSALARAPVYGSALARAPVYGSALARAPAGLSLRTPQGRRAIWLGNPTTP